MDFLQIFQDYWLLALTAFFLGLLAVVFALKLFPKMGLMDRPHLYGLSRAPIPYYGGVAIFFAFIVGVLLFVPLEKNVIGLIVGAGLIFLLGFLDDRFNLNPWIRLVGQFFAALILVSFGIGILSFNLPFFGTVDLSLPILSALFTIFWVMTIVNTMNFVDGVSGLTSGVSFIGASALFLLSINPLVHENPASQTGVATLSLILAMVSLAFLIFDFPKAKILMGDSGSTFLGFMLASLAIFSGGKVATAFLVLGIPILDMIWVIVRRTLNGKKFWQGDLLHLHHRLLNLGLSPRIVVGVYLLVTAFFGVMAVSFVGTNQKFFMVLGLATLMVLLVGAFVFLAKKR